MKFEGTIKVECDRPDIVYGSYVKYEKDCCTVTQEDSAIKVVIQSDSEKVFRKTFTSTCEKLTLSMNAIEYCKKNDSE